MRRRGAKPLPPDTSGPPLAGGTDTCGSSTSSRSPSTRSGIANRAAQLPAELRTPGVEYDFVPVKNSCRNADSAYELLILDAYIAEAGLRSEEEGYDAVVMDTVSDSGLAALRSRLTIPVLGPGLVQQHIAAMLGRASRS